MYILPAPSQRRPPFARELNPVGRWDAVMALEPAALIGVVTADGIPHTGRYVRAGMHWLRMFEKGSEIEFPRGDVARVDYLGTTSGSVERIAGGAAVGAVAGGVSQMFFALAFAGKLVFPWRAVALGAGGGAVGGAMDSAARRESRAIYIAPQLVR
jgi:hypothetical protein